MAHKNRVVVADRRRKAAELALMGWTQQAIGARLGASQATIARDLAAITEQWRREAVRDVGLVREQQLQKLMLVEYEAWGGWQRSQTPMKSATLTDTKGVKQSRTSLKHAHGDPRFLEQIKGCISQRCALMGLQALPLTQSALGNTGESLEARRARLLEAFQHIFQREETAASGAATRADQPGSAGNNAGPGPDQNQPREPKAPPGGQVP
jgi:hypothetical protein